MGVHLLLRWKLLMDGRRSALSSRPTLDGDGRTVHVRALSYGPVDTKGTSWARGVFSDWLRSGATVPVCWAHDHSRVVGRVIGHDDRSDGLYLTIRLSDPDDVPDARMVRSLLRDGAVKAVSVGFGDGFGRPDPTHRGAVQITRARLRELSFVVDASVPGAEVLGVRSADNDEELTPEELDEIERVATIGYSAAELSAMRSRQALDLEVRAAMVKLDRMSADRSLPSEAGIRARAATMPTRVDPKEQAARERLRRQLEESDRMPPHPILEDPPAYRPPDPRPDDAPGEDLALIAMAATERGENAGQAVRAAQDGWRATYGALYAKTQPTSNEPDWRGERPYPPDDLLQVAAAEAAGRGENPRVGVEAAVRAWRVARGFEQA